MSRTIFENANVFDGVSPKITGPRHVLVEGRENNEVSEQPLRLDGAQRIDCRGKTLMPGLIDCHVHIYIESLKIGPPEPPVTYRAQ